MLTEEEWVQAENSRVHQKPTKQPRLYWYGVVQAGDGRRYPFVVKHREKVPRGNVEIRGPVENVEVAKEESKRLAKLPFQPHRKAFVQPPPEDEEVQEGAVAMHVDGNVSHMVIVLRVRSNGDAACLMFSSNPEFGKVARRAKKEELALSGFICTKTTYLASCVRHKSDLFPNGLVFSQDRTDALYREFFGS